MNRVGAHKKRTPKDRRLQPNIGTPGRSPEGTWSTCPFRGLPTPTGCQRRRRPSGRPAVISRCAPRQKDPRRHSMPPHVDDALRAAGCSFGPRDGPRQCVRLPVALRHPACSRCSAGSGAPVVRMCQVGLPRASGGTLLQGDAIPEHFAALGGWLGLRLHVLRRHILEPGSLGTRLGL